MAFSGKVNWFFVNFLIFLPFLLGEYLSLLMSGLREVLILYLIFVMIMDLEHLIICVPLRICQGLPFSFIWSSSLPTNKLHKLMDVEIRSKGLVSAIYIFLLESFSGPLAIHQIWMRDLNFPDKEICWLLHAPPPLADQPDPLLTLFGIVSNPSSV